jgi:N-acetylglucosamine kinase-like BadF-type ATPase
MTVIGIDLGGSGSRLAAEGGTPVSGPAFTVSGGRADHAAVVRTLVRSIPPTGPVTAVGVCAAGLLAFGEPASIRAAVLEAWPDAAVVVASDAVGAVAGAWGADGGGVVAAGTGSVAFATDFAGVWLRSDGWGYVLGDDGGAAWIGSRGLAAGLRAHDGRPHGSERLLEALRDTFGDPVGLPDVVHSAPNPATLLASFAPSVSAAAGSGDAVARHIVDDAARHLADTGLSVLRAGVPERLALVGGLASEPLISEAFSARVGERRPEVRISIGVGNPLDGALLFARQAADGLVSPRDPYLVHFPSSSTPSGGTS